MPVITPPAKVLVTGANGFLGTWILRTLLHRGYSARAAVRSVEKGETLKKLLTAEEGSDVERLEYVLISDLCDVSKRLTMLQFCPDSAVSSKMASTKPSRMLML